MISAQKCKRRGSLEASHGKDVVTEPRGRYVNAMRDSIQSSAFRAPNV